MTPLSPTGPGDGPEAFVLHQVIDRRHQGIVAAAFEHPAGWQARSDVVWTFEHMSFPVVSYAQAVDPQGVERFEFLPVESFCWVEPDYGYNQPGQNVLGQTCLAPAPPADVLLRWVLPRYRGNRPGLRVVGAGPVPQLAQALGLNLGGLPGEGVCVRVAYQEGGKAFEEEFYGVQVLQRVPYHGPMGTMVQTNWGLARLFCFRAEQGRLDARRGVFWRIACSVRPNPRWEQRCAGLMQQLQAQFDQYIQMGYSQIQAAGQLSRTISAHNDAFLAGFEQQRQATRAADAARSAGTGDRSPNDGFSEYLRGVETYDDPHHGTSQQDYNHRYHWTDGFGHYQHSSDPFFNPNAGSSQSWTLMEPTRR